MATISDPKIVLGAIESAQNFVRTGWVNLEEQPVWRVYRYWNTEVEDYALIWTPEPNAELKRSQFVDRVTLIYECKPAERCAFCRNYLAPPEPKGDEPSSLHRSPSRCRCTFEDSP